MAGEQNLDRMGGFRRAMPFTFGCMAIGGLALSGVPPFAGFFSKDEILALLIARDDWHIVLAVLGYVGSFLTAIYTWRMIFRAFYDEPVEQARELEGGHLYHAPEHTNPATGEVEDTDVGFPGPEHHIAEREWSMKVAMGLLAVGAVVIGFLQVAEDHARAAHVPRADVPRLALLRGARAVRRRDLDRPRRRRAARARRASRSPTGSGSRTRPGRPRSARASRRVHAFFVHKWYFDELIDTVVVRPFAMFGRFARDVFERVVVNGVLVGGPSGAVRAGSAAVRAVQSGFLRYYAALLLVGVAGLGLYFLIAAS